MNEDTSGIPESAPSKDRNILILGGISVGLILALVVILIFDPFGLNLFGGGKISPVLQAVPADTAMYFGLELGNVKCEDLNRIVWTFSDDLRQEGGCVLDQLYESLDEELQYPYNLSIEEDFSPWMGESMGAWLRGMDLSGSTGDMDAAFVIEARNPQAADEFLEKYRQRVTEDSGNKFVEEVYGSVTIYTLDTDFDYERLALGRSGDLVIISPNPESVKAGVDAQEGESLGDSKTYQEALDQIPEGEVMTFYLDYQRYIEFTMQSSQDTAAFEEIYGMDPTVMLNSYTKGLNSTVMGLSIVEEGLQIDTAILYNLDEASTTMKDSLEFTGVEPATDSLLPEDTFVYFVGQRLDLGWSLLRDMIFTFVEEEDFDQSMALLQFTLGFNPNEDLFPLLDGEWALGIMPSTTGILAEDETINLPMGFVILAETSDPEGMVGLLENLNRNLDRQGIGSVESFQGEMTVLYELVDPFTGETLIALGVGESYLSLGSSHETLDSIFANGPSLAENKGYREAFDRFPGGFEPMLFIDIPALGSLLKESVPEFDRVEFTEWWDQYMDPIQSYATAGSAMKDGVVHRRAILSIDTE